MCGHFAGRAPAGTTSNALVGPTLRKCGIRHIRRDLETNEEREFFVIGAACSEIFSGKNLAQVLKPGLEYEQRTMNQLENGDFADSLSIHTSAGLPPALDDFLEALRPHLPWDGGNDWCASLQLEGGTAVFAGVDLLLQLQKARGQTSRTKIAVAERSYHGPPATAPGAPSSPLFEKTFQVTYPAPHIFRKPEEDIEQEFKDFLSTHGDEVGVILFEPQWGSSNGAKPWPQELLKRLIGLSHEKGILVLCDEIMCGLGRHGKGSCFLSKDWGLDPDAVTFGKSVATGVYPLSGAIIKAGTAELNKAAKGVLHMHTYAGSSQRALMAGTEVLRKLPSQIAAVQKMGAVMEEALKRLEVESNGFLKMYGQGLMWAGVFSGDTDHRTAANKEFKKQCRDAGVWPYFIPLGGFMITPVYDVSEEDLRKALCLLSDATHKTIAAFP
jgi:adenosylmethionine-8-amino-7-oxononanoate aminotransferase